MQRNTPIDFKHTFLAQHEKKPRLNTPDIPGEFHAQSLTLRHFTTAAGLPPLSTTEFAVTESKNSDPNLLRATMYALPTTNATLEQLQIPLGVVFHPLSTKAFFVDSKSPVLCRQCEAFLNPHCELGADFFKCNICKTATLINQAELDGTKHATIEYEEREQPGRTDTSTVNETLYENCAKESPVFAFCFENSTNFNFFTESVLAAQSAVAKSDFRYENAIFAVFGASVTFFTIKNGKVCETTLFDDEIYVADCAVKIKKLNDESGLLGEIEEGSKDVSKNMSKNIDKNMSKNIDKNIDKNLDISMSNNLKMNTLDINTSKMNNLEMNTLKNNNLNTLNNNLNVKNDIIKKLFDKIKKARPAKNTFGILPLLNILQKMGVFFKGMKILLFSNSECGKSLVDFRVCVNAISAVKSDGLCETCYATGGVFLRFDRDTLAADVCGIATEEAVFAATVQVKNSDCLAKKAVFCNGDAENANRLFFAGLSERSAISYAFSIDEPIRAGEPVFLQVICRYVRIDGRKKALVANLGLVGAQGGEVFENLCLDAVFSLLAKGAISANYKVGLEKLDLTACLSFYRNKVCKGASPIHLHLPESIKLLPGLCQSVAKSRIFNDAVDPAMHRLVLGMSVVKTVRFFYPRMVALSDFFNERNLARVRAVRLSSLFVDTSEVYVVENGVKILIYFGNSVLDELKDALLGEGECEEKTVLNDLVDQIKCEYGCEMRVDVVEQGKGREIEFHSLMVEDAIYNYPSYEDYICNLHMKVKRY